MRDAGEKTKTQYYRFCYSACSPCYFSRRGLPDCNLSRRSGKCTDSLCAGPAFSYNDKREIGIVTGVSTAPAYFKGTDKAGNPVHTEMEEHSMLYVTIEADAVQTNTGYIVGGHSIQSGMSLAVQFPELYCEAQCISVNVIE